MAKSIINIELKASIFSLVIISMALLAAILPFTNATCCNSYTPGICADCSDAAGFTDGYVLGSCPAVKGDCNIFGCNCVSGCRQPPVGKKGCAPTAHLHSPRLAKSDRHCWLVDEHEKCNGREFWRTSNNLVYTN